jgi:hypothetical protein
MDLQTGELLYYHPDSNDGNPRWIPVDEYNALPPKGQQ